MDYSCYFPGPAWDFRADRLRAGTRCFAPSVSRTHWPLVRKARATSNVFSRKWYLVIRPSRSSNRIEYAISKVRPVGKACSRNQPNAADLFPSEITSRGPNAVTSRLRCMWARSSLTAFLPLCNPSHGSAAQQSAEIGGSAAVARAAGVPLTMYSTSGAKKRSTAEASLRITASRYAAINCEFDWLRVLMSFVESSWPAFPQLVLAALWSRHCPRKVE